MEEHLGGLEVEDRLKDLVGLHLRVVVNGGCILRSAGTFGLQRGMKGLGGGVGCGGWWEGRGRGEKWNNKTTRRDLNQRREASTSFFFNRPSAMESGVHSSTLVAFRPHLSHLSTTTHHRRKRLDALSVSTSAARFANGLTRAMSIPSGKWKPPAE